MYIYIYIYVYYIYIYTYSCIIYSCQMSMCMCMYAFMYIYIYIVDMAYSMHIGSTAIPVLTPRACACNIPDISVGMGGPDVQPLADANTSDLLFLFKAMIQTWCWGAAKPT